MTLWEVVIFLAAAVIAVPLARLLGVGAILGYLAAGVVIGPSVLGLVDSGDEVESTMHFAEFGVVLLLFIIGLELAPSRLWALRKPVFGLGALQVLGTGALIALTGWALGLAPLTATVVGLVLALSSTAFALQLLSERSEMTTRHGRAAFAVLLFQDLAVIPLLAILPLLAPGQSGGFEWLAVGKALAVVAGIIVLGRLALRPVLRAVAQARTNEVFTAMALLVVIGTALLADWAGLSMALGAFLAGVLLADSEYRHALEADIEPFKNLLLGLFFISVGMSVNLGLLAAVPLQVIGVVVGLLAIKAASLYAFGRMHGLDTRASRALAVTLAQGGEFAFVLFEVAGRSDLVPEPLIELLIVAVSLSMAATPLLFVLNERLFPDRGPANSRAFDVMPDDHPRVLIAGFGRFGQIIARILNARREPFTALELDPSQVDFVRKFGNKTHFGDASRADLLRAAGVEHADLFVLAIQEEAASLAIARCVRELNPGLRIIARARNRAHAYKLMELGVRDVIRDTFYSSAHAASQVLIGLGYSDGQARKTADAFVRLDEERLFAAFGKHDDLEQMIGMAQQSQRELEQLFEQDTRGDGP